MKKLLMILLAATALAACDNGPTFYGLTQQEKESYAQSIQGEYPGRYTIAYTDLQTPESDTKLLRETVDSATFSFSDLTMHTFIFNNFPLRLVARVVDDPELSQALSTLPSMGLTGSYEFKRATENGKVECYFDINPVSLSLNYGGQQHNLVLHFRNTNAYIILDKGQIEGGTAFEQGRQLMLELSGIYEGDRPLQQFADGWQDGAELMAVFHFGL